MEELMEQKKYSTNAIVEAGLIAVFIAVILIVTGYAPVLSFLGVLILPIPITVLYLRQNFKTTLCCILVSTIVTSMVFDPITSVSAAINYSLVGLTLGYCIKNKKSSYYTIITLTVACILSYILSLLILAVFVEKTNLVNLIKEYINTIMNSFNSSMEQIKGYYRDMGMSNEQLQNIDKVLSSFNKDILIMMLPAAVVGYGFVSAYVNYVIASVILKKLRYEVNSLMPFSEFYISNLVGAFLIGCICIGIILNGRGVSGAEYLYKATFILLSLILSLNGIATAVYYLQRKRLMPKGTIVFIIVLSFILALGNIYLMVGFVEMILDLRRLDPYRIRKV